MILVLFSRIVASPAQLRYTHPLSRPSSFQLLRVLSSVSITYFELSLSVYGWISRVNVNCLDGLCRRFKVQLQYPVEYKGVYVSHVLASTVDTMRPECT